MFGIDLTLGLSCIQTSILRQIVAGPRLQHPEAGLDLCYVTDNSESAFVLIFLARLFLYLLTVSSHRDFGPLH